MNQIICKISRVSKRTEDILFIDIDKNETFEKRDFVELRMAARKIGAGQKFYNIINVGEFTLPNKEAREASSSISGCAFKMADAFVVKTMAQRIMATMMMKINKSAVPTKVFSNINDAENWIDNLKKQSLLPA